MTIFDRRAYAAFFYAPIASLTLLCSGGVYGFAAVTTLQERIRLEQARLSLHGQTSKPYDELRKEWDEQLKQDRRIALALTYIGMGSVPVTAIASAYGRRRLRRSLDEELRELFRDEGQ